MKDPSKNLSFLRPIGGAVEFGETSAEAMIREIAEEINSRVSSLELLGNFENIFVFNNQTKHEIVYLYDVLLSDRKFYETDNIQVKEENDYRIAKWVSCHSLDKYTIYPPQIIKYINPNQNF